jgi:hypothetical protein
VPLVVQVLRRQHKELKVLQVHKEPKDFKDLKGRAQEHKVIQALRELKVPKVLPHQYKVLKDPQVLKVQ